MRKPWNRQRGGIEARDERELYESLPMADRKWICFMLDIGGITPGETEEWRAVVSNWSREYDFSTVSSAIGVIQKARSLWLIQEPDPAYNFDTWRYPPLVLAGVFSLQFGRCSTEASFRFLFERLFGGSIRPLIPSVFAASALHPASQAVKIEEIDFALFERDSGWGTHDCVFRPVWTF